MHHRPHSLQSSGLTGHNRVGASMLMSWLRWCLLCIVITLTSITLSLLSGLSHPTPAKAATNGTLNFQARLLTSAGALIPDGTYNVEFKIYDSASAGSSAQGVCSLNSSTDDCWWLETRTGANKVTVKNGYISANLGSVTAFGSSIPWDQDLYLTINIGGTGTPSWDGEMLATGSVRMKISGVPYAFAAGKLQATSGSNSTNITITTPTGTRSILFPDAGGTVALAGSGTFTSNGVLYGNGTSSIQATAAGTTGQCLVATTGSAPTWGTCAGTGSGVTLQAAYNNSTNPEITLNSTNGALTIRNDATNSIAGNLLEVQDNAGTTTFLGVTKTGISASVGYTQTGSGANTFSGASSFTAAGTALSVTNNATVGGTLGVTGAGTFSSTLNVAAAGGYYYGGTGSPLSAELTRTVPTTVNDIVEIGNFSLTNGAHNFRISVTVPSSAFSVSKQYIVPVKYDATANTWYKLTPTTDSSSYGGNDYDLDINVSANIAYLRLRRTSGATAGTAYLRIESTGYTSDVFTATSATASVSAPTSLYGQIYQNVIGNVGIGTTGTPASLLSVGGTTGNFQVNSSGQVVAGTWQGSTIGVSYGGTGAGSFTSNGILYGNGTSAIQVTAAGTTGQCLNGNTGSAPTWGSCGGSGVTTVGALDAGTANANAAYISGSTIYMQSASASFAGVVNTTTQTLAGAKTFSGAATFSAAGTALSVTNDASIGNSLTVSGTNVTTGNVVSISGASLTTGMALSISGTGTDTAALTRSLAQAVLTANPGSSSNTGFVGINGQVSVNSNAGNIANNVTGLQGTIAVGAASGTINLARGTIGSIVATGGATISSAYSLSAVNPTVTAGAITNNYGLYIANQTSGTSDYGVYIQGADTYALYVNAGSSYFGGATNVANTLTVDTNSLYVDSATHRVAMGIATTPETKLDIRLGTGSDGIHLGNGANQGGYFNSPGSTALYLAGGAQYNSFSSPNYVFTARGSTVASGAMYESGNINFWANTGLTNGNTFNATSALFVQGSTGNIGVGNTNPANFKLQVSGNIGPNADATYDLGSSTNRFQNLYLSGGVLQGGYYAPDNDNLLYNSDFETGTNVGWTGSNTPVIINPGYSGKYAGQFTGANTLLSNDYIPVDPTKDVLQLEGWLKKSVAGTTPGVLYFGYMAYDSSYSLITTAPCGTYCYFAASAYTLPADGNWHKFNATTTGEGTSYPNFPVNTRFVRVLGLINWTASSDAVTQFDHISLKRLNYGPLFVGNNFSSTNLNDQNQATQLYTTSSNNFIITPPSSGNVGIGTASPGSSKLNVVGSSSSSLNFGLSVTQSNTTSASATNYNFGTDSLINETVSTGQTNSGYIQGLRVQAYLNNGVATGTLSNAYGVNAVVGLNTGSAGTLSNAYGIFSNVNNGGSGTITNGYGVYVADVMATTGYGIYQAGSNDINYFAGNVGIGDTTPVALLTVGNGDLFQVSSGGAVYNAVTNSAANVQATAIFDVLTDTATSASSTAVKFGNITQLNKTGSAVDTGYDTGAFFGQYNITGGSTAGVTNFLSRIQPATGTTITSASDFVADAQYGSAGAVTSRYGFQVRDYNKSGTQTLGTQYGLYVNSLTSGSANYAIYVNGSTQSYFGGDVQLAGAAAGSSSSFAVLGATKWRLQQTGGDESNAGVIDYRGFDATALNIVGAGTTGSNRLVRIFDHLSIGAAPSTSYDLLLGGGNGISTNGGYTQSSTGANTFTGASTFVNSSNSTTAFRIQSASAAQTLFTADTSNNVLRVGTNTSGSISWSSTSFSASQQLYVGFYTAPYGHTTTVYDGKAYTFGGFEFNSIPLPWGDKTVNTIDTNSTSTSSGGGISVAYHSSVAFEGIIYMWSGTTSGGAANNTTTLSTYNTATSTLTSSLSYTGSPTARMMHSAVVYNNKMYVWGGQNTGGTALNTMDVFDFATTTWSSGTAGGTARYGHVATVYNGKMYIWGGYSGSAYLNTVNIYDFATSTWTTGTTGGTARVGATGVQYGSKIYIHGGYVQSLTSLDILEVYDTVTGTWSTAQSGGTPRAFASAFVYNGKMYVSGGQTGHNSASGFQSSKFMQIYDLNTGVWNQTVSNNAGTRELHTAVEFNSKMYVWGGLDGTGTSATVSSSMDVYSSSSNSWQTSVPYTGAPTARASHTAVVYNGKMYVWGGMTNVSTGISTAVNTLDIYDFATSSWTTGTAGGTARAYHSAVVYNGKMYVWGGKNTAGTVLSTIDSYDFAAGTWTAGVSYTGSPTARYAHTAVAYNGKIFVWGGDNSSNTALSSVDIYTISTSVWTAGATGGTARANHSAVVYNGKMYVWGGSASGGVYGSNTTALNTTDVYDLVGNTWTTGTGTGGTARYFHTAVAINGRAYVWGGETSGNSASNFVNNMDILDLGTANPTTLVLGYGGADPSGEQGAIYYNTSTNTMRCYGVSVGWQNCNDSGWEKSDGGGAIFNLQGSSSTLQIQGINGTMFAADSASNAIKVGTNSSAQGSWLNTGSVVSGGTARNAHAGVAYNNKIYYWGGYNGTALNSMDIYNTSTNSWSTVAAGGTARYEHTGVLYNGKIYYWGGKNSGGTALNSMDIYDIINNSWSTVTANGTARSTHSAIVNNGKIYFWGGRNNAGTAINTMDIYDIAGNTWTTGTTGGTARYGQSAIVYNGKMYAWGGFTGSAYLNTMDIYDIAGNSWTTGIAGGTARYAHTAVVNNGKMYVWGGSNGTYINQLESFDLTSNIWSRAAVGGDPRTFAAAVVYNTKMYIWGGYNGTYFNSMDIYDFVAGGWSNGSTITTARVGHTAISYNGKMYVWGGLLNGSYLNTIDIYDYATGAWSSGAAGGTGRYLHSAVVYNGKMYIWGGSNGGGALNTVDIYDIAANSWSTGTAGGTARWGQTYALYNGKMYNWSGVNGGGTTINTMDIYDIAGNSWTTGTGTGGTGRGLATAVVYNGKIYNWGGIVSGSYVNTMDVYDIAGNSWSTGTAGGTARYEHTAVFYNNKMYIWGGYNGAEMNSLDIYDFVSGNWSSGPAGGIARNDHSAVVYGSRMYAFGGSKASAYFNSIEILDLDNNSPTLMVLGNGSGDPTGQQGGLYYNSSTNSLRCYGVSVGWQNCNSWGWSQVDGNTVFGGSGNVGIGTSTPQDKLEVAGNIRIGKQTDAGGTVSDWTLQNTTGGTIAAGGTSSIDGVISSAVFNGSLYVGTAKSGQAEVYRRNADGSWTRVSFAAGQIINGATNAIDKIRAMIVYNGQLYIGTEKLNSGEVYRYDGGTTWTRVSQGTGQVASGATTSIDAVSAMAVYGGQLYVGTKEASLAEVYTYSASSGAWVRVSGAQASSFYCAYYNGGLTYYADQDEITAMTVVGGHLYVASFYNGSNQGMVCMYESAGVQISYNVSYSPFVLATSVNTSAYGPALIGNTTGTANIDGYVSLIGYDGHLYAGTKENSSTEVYELEEPPTLTTYGGSFYKTGLWRKVTQAAGTIAASGTTSIDTVASMAVYNGVLYIGTGYYNTNAGKAEVYAYGGGTTWTRVSNASGQIMSGGTSSIDTISTMLPFGGQLYIGTTKTSTAQVYSFNAIEGQSYSLLFNASSDNAGATEYAGLQNTASISFMAEQQAGGVQGAGGTGTFLFSHTISTITGAYDLAEDYPTRDDQLQAGDLITIDPHETGFVQRSTGLADNAIIGVYSEHPGFRLSQQDDTIDGAKAVPVALAGRVPIKVSTENGPVLAGDPLTSSSVPGVAMKATSAGRIVGMAMEGFNGAGVGKVMAFVNPNFYAPSASLTASSIFSNINVGDMATFNDMTVHGDAQFDGKITVNDIEVKHDLKVAGETTLGGHLQSVAVTAPTITAEVALGVVDDQPGATIQPAVSVNGSDTAGTVTLVAGQSPTTGNLAKLVFNKPYTAQPRVSLTPISSDSLSLRVYVIRSLDGFELVTLDTPIVGKTYTFDYIIIGSAVPTPTPTPATSY